MMTNAGWTSSSTSSADASPKATRSGSSSVSTGPKLSLMSVVVLDAWAALAFLQREGQAAVIVRRLLRRAVRGNVRLRMNVVNLGEVYYRTGRVQGRDQADETLEIVRRLRLKILPATDPVVLAAARFKIDHTVSYADAFAVVATLEQNGTLLTGDPELLQIQDAVQIEKLHRNGR